MKSKLEILNKEEIPTCTSCSLHETRIKTVSGSGSSSDIMIIGEAPGATEDKEGKPFIGLAGKMLDKMLESIDIKRDQVYVSNTIKCRPPNNRPPMAHEIDACSKHLKKEIDYVDPKIILTLGLTASNAFIGTYLHFMKNIHGKVYQSKIYNKPFIPTYHPAALLRNPALKDICWSDLQVLQQFLRESNEKER